MMYPWIWIGYSACPHENLKGKSMSHGKDLPEVIEKTDAEIQQTVQAIESSDLPKSTKNLVLAGVRLAAFLPK